MNDKEIKSRFVATMQEITRYIQMNAENIELNQVNSLIECILKTQENKKRVFVYGAGRSGFIGRCFAQRLMHLGVDSYFISDAVTPQYGNDDLLILISGSGETTSPVAIAQKARKIGGTIVLLTGNLNSKISNLADLSIKIQGKSKDVAIDQQTLAPYTSLFDISTLSVLDSVGGTLMEIMGVSEGDIDKRHASIE